MSRDPGQPELTEAEMGAPVEELAEIGEPASEGFFSRVRGSIERRRLGSELTDLGWNGLFAVILEFVDLAVQMVTGSGRTDKRR